VAVVVIYREMKSMCALLMLRCVILTSRLFKKIKPKMRGTWGDGTYQYFGRKWCQLREARRNLVDG